MDLLNRFLQFFPRTVLIVTLAASSPLLWAQASFADNEEAMQFATEIAKRQNLDAEWVKSAVGSAVNVPTVQRLMRPAPRGTAKNWTLYRSRFVEPIRIRQGLKFWQENRRTLERAEKEFGVPAEIIASIIGVETLYGRNMGNFRVMDALMTLAFDFPTEHPRAAERTAFFRSEVEHFLSLKSKSKIDPLSLRGSYAGAMGLPQFMPSSWARFAVDYDGDGKIDLINSVDDAIGSVANYFIAFGWKSGMPTHYPVTLMGSEQDKLDLLVPDILPTFSLKTLESKGAVLGGQAKKHQGPLALVELQNGANGSPQYVVGTENFYTITRYNWSSYYAMAVIELAQELKKRI